MALFLHLQCQNGYDITQIDILQIFLTAQIVCLFVSQDISQLTKINILSGNYHITAFFFFFYNLAPMSLVFIPISDDKTVLTKEKSDESTNSVTVRQPNTRLAKFIWKRK